MPKNTNDRREMTPEEIAEREERFRAFFSTTAVDLPEEMTRRGSGQTEGKTKKRFGFLGRNKAAQDAEQTEERPLEMPTGEVLLDQNSGQQRCVASLTKMMTALLLLESGKDLDETITVPASLTQEFQNIRSQNGSTILLAAGEQLRRIDLLYALLVCSANDAASVIAWDVAGSIPAFVQQMNARAAQLGCTSTRFSCPHGLYDDGNVSNAQDMAKIAIACAQYELYRQIADTLQYEIPATNLHAARSIRSTNKMLDPENSCYRAYIHGMKTGFTTKAGRCYVTAAQQGDTIYGLVILGSDRKNIYNEAAAILDWAFAGCPQPQAAA